MSSAAARAVFDTQVFVLDLYCRISQDEDGTWVKVDAQEAQGLQWIAAHEHEGYVHGKTHKDNDRSAWNPDVIRPDFNRLMERLAKGQAHGVWFRNLDRFTRKPMEGEQLLALADKGTRVIGADGTYNLRTPRGRKNFREDLASGAYESDNISWRTRRGKARKAMRGASNATKRGFARPGYLPKPKRADGSTDNDALRIVVPPEQLAREREAVQDAAQRLLDGATMDSIVQEWNGAGLRTVNGKLWDSTRIREMLLKPSIAGLQLVRKVDEDDQEDHLAPITQEEPVLDRQTWEAIRLHFGARKRGRPLMETNLLAGMLTCGRCGGVCYSRPEHSKPPYPDTGELKRSYWCQPNRKTGKGCGRVAIDQRHADAAAAVLVVARLADPRHAAQAKLRAAKDSSVRGQLQAKLDKLNKDMTAIAGKTGTPGWTLERVDLALANIAPQVTELEEQLAKLGKPRKGTELTVDAQADWDDAKTTAQRRELVRRAFPEGLVLLPAKSTGRHAKLEKRLAPKGLEVAR